MPHSSSSDDSYVDLNTPAAVPVRRPYISSGPHSCSDDSCSEDSCSEDSCSEDSYVDPRASFGGSAGLYHYHSAPAHTLNDSRRRKRNQHVNTVPSETPVSRFLAAQRLLPNSRDARQQPRPSALRTVANDNKNGVVGTGVKKQSKHVSFNPIVEFDDDSLNMDNDSNYSESLIDDRERWDLRVPQEPGGKNAKGGRKQTNSKFEDWSDDGTNESYIDPYVINVPFTGKREVVAETRTGEKKEKEKENFPTASKQQSPPRANTAKKRPITHGMKEGEVRVALKEEIRHTAANANVKATMTNQKDSADLVDVIIPPGPPKVANILIKAKDGKTIFVGSGDAGPTPLRKRVANEVKHETPEVTKPQKPVFVKKVKKNENRGKERDPEEENGKEDLQTARKKQMAEALIKKKIPGAAIRPEEKKAPKSSPIPKPSSAKTPPGPAPVTAPAPVPVSSSSSSSASSTSSSDDSGWQLPDVNTFMETNNSGWKQPKPRSPPEPLSPGKSKNKSKSKSSTPHKSKSSSKAKLSQIIQPTMNAPPGFVVHPPPMHVPPGIAVPPPPQFPLAPPHFGIASVRNWQYQPEVPVPGAGEGWSSNPPSAKKSSSSSSSAASSGSKETSNSSKSTSSKHSVQSNELWMSGALPAASPVIVPNELLMSGPLPAASPVLSRKSSTSSSSTVKPTSAKSDSTFKSDHSRARRILEGFRHVAPPSWIVGAHEAAQGGVKDRGSHRSASSKHPKKSVHIEEPLLVPPETLLSPKSGYAPSSNYQPPTVESDRSSKNSRKDKSDRKSKSSLPSGGPILEENEPTESVWDTRAESVSRRWDRPVEAGESAGGKSGSKDSKQSARAAAAEQIRKAAQEIGSRSPKKSRSDGKRTPSKRRETSWEQEPEHEDAREPSLRSSKRSSKSNGSRRESDNGVVMWEQQDAQAQGDQAWETHSRPSTKSSKSRDSVAHQVAAPGWDWPTDAEVNAGAWEAGSYDSQRSRKPGKSQGSRHDIIGTGFEGSRGSRHSSRRASEKSKKSSSVRAAESGEASSHGSKSRRNQKAGDDEPYFQYLHGTIPVRVSSRRLEGNSL